MKKIYYFLIIGWINFFVISDSLGQSSFIPPSPNSMAVIKASNDEGLYRGNVNISIPIYNVKNRSISTDISIKYTGSNGIKVQQVAELVGLGWSLIAGGVITRSTRGSSTDNQEAYGYSSIDPSSAWLNSTPGSLDFAKAFNLLPNVDHSADLAPDIFNSSFGGRIFFNRNRSCYFAKNQGYKVIQDGVYSSDKTWIIADGNGTKYYFGKNPNDRVTIYDAEISSWNLSEILSLDGCKIVFEYEKTETASFKYYLNEKSTLNGNPEPDPFFPNYKEYIHQYQESYLKKIKTSDATVEFNYGDRLDFTGTKALSDIKILDQEFKLITKYVFETGYFDGEEKRLKLNAIRQYNGQLDKTNLVASFHYNESVNLPRRNASSTDHWGYLNADVSGKRFVSEGADKSPNLAKCQANILQSIEWPTGGKTEYGYELNTFKKDGQEYYGPGLRIKSVSEINNMNDVLTTTYGYVDSQNVTTGLLNNLFGMPLSYTSTYNYTYYNQFNQLVAHQLIVEQDQPVNDIFDLNGISVGYSSVTVRHPNLSSEIYKFSDFAEYPDSISTFYYRNVDKITQNLVSMNFNPQLHKHFNSFTSNAMLRGLVKEKQELNSSNKLVRKTSYLYSAALGERVPGSQIVRVNEGTGQNGVGEIFYNYSSLYYEKVVTPRLVKKTVTNYDPITQNVLVSTVERNEYNLSNYPSLVTRNIQSTSSVDSLITDYRYANEFTGIPFPNAASSMLIKNLLKPLEIVRKKSSSGVSRVTGAAVNFYKHVGYSGHIVPDIIASLKIDNPISNYVPLSSNGSFDNRIITDVSFDNYGIDGEVLQYTENNLIKTSLIWDRNKSVVLAEGKNASSNSVVFDNAETSYGTNAWDGGNGFTASLDAYSGKKSYHLSQCYKLLPSGEFQMSYRFKGDTLTLNATGIVLLKTSTIGSDSRGWKTHIIHFSIPSATNVYIQGNNTPSQIIDDIKIIPYLASMPTYTYGLIKELTTSTDDRLKTTFLEYDDFNRISTVKDQNWNILESFNYQLVNNSNWQDNGARQCVVNSNNRNTGEQLMQERDINPISSSYNQTRWKSLGYKLSCFPIVYAKLFIESVSFDSDGDGGGNKGNLVVKLFEDSACTIPTTIPIAIGINIRIKVTGYDNSITEESLSPYDPLPSYLNYTYFDPPFGVNNYTYSLLPGDYYIVVP